MANAPEKKIRVGQICLNIWSNEPKGERNFPTKSISFEKRYQDKEGKWQSSQSYQLNDLMKIQIAIDEALRYLFLKQEQKEVTTAEEQPEVPITVEEIEDKPVKKFSAEEIRTYKEMVKNGSLTPDGFKSLTGEAY